jgi:hypothetical protein
MKNILFTLALLVSFSTFGQELNGFKYALINEIKYEGDYEIAIGIEEVSEISAALNLIGIKALKPGDSFPEDLINNECLGINVQVLFYRGGGGTIPAYFSKLSFADCAGNLVTTIEKRHQGRYDGALKKVLKILRRLKYSFSNAFTPNPGYPEVEKINLTEKEFIDYFDNEQLNQIEGVYKSSNYRIAIKKFGLQYKGIIISSKYSQWKRGDVKMIIESTAAKNVFSIQYMDHKKSSIDTFGSLDKGAVLKIDIKFIENENPETGLFLKMYTII